MSFQSLFNRNADFVGNHYENAGGDFAFDHPAMPVVPAVLIAGGWLMDRFIPAATAAIGIDLQNTTFGVAAKTITDADMEKISARLAQGTPRTHIDLDAPRTFAEHRNLLIGLRAERDPFKVIGMALKGF